jgi:lipopolysaccharide/colanic/teichoic acid biosynthesis glycosyltransferase
MAEAAVGVVRDMAPRVRALESTDCDRGTSRVQAAPRSLRATLVRSGRREFSLRVFDIVTSVVLLLGAWPVMLIAAVLIKLTSRGPVIYRQQRVGRHHRVFTLYKFRSMADGAERDTGPIWASAQDSRITPVGRVLRKTRIDELPQLFNVLQGNMSLVGPRPERPHFVAQYEALQGVRLAVKPGITGLAQIRASYDLRPDRKLKYDALYVHNRSLFLNIYILVQTIPVMLKRKGW